MKKIIILFLILLLAVFFRFYQLNRVPPSPSLDEVSLGWNTYSILKTGHDEFGNRWPILLRAYDDWRPAGYVYLLLPLVKLFGLSVLTVRLPSTILSLIAVLLTYFLVKEIFSGHKSASFLALLTAFLLAISPWHIYLSRLGHEVNAGLTFLILAVFFFLKAVNQKSKVFLIFAAFVFGLSFYTYQSLRIFIPLFILALFFIYKKELLLMKKSLFLAGLVGLVLLLPIVKAGFSKESLIRFQATSIFSHQPEILETVSLRISRDYEKNYLMGLIFDNRRVALGLTGLRNYFSHFDPAWLFFNSGRESHKIPGLGVFYLWELPLLLLGIYQLVKFRYFSKSRLLLLSWFLLAFLPGGLTTQAPHVMRTFNLLPVPQILSGLGGIALWQKFFKSSKIIFLPVLLILLLSFSYLYHQYFVNFPYEQSASFQYPLAQAVKYVLKNENQYSKIVFTNQNQGYQSYMFFLFFSFYDPDLYFHQGGTPSGGYQETHQIGKYEFRPINWLEEEKSQDIFYIGNIEDFPLGIESVQIFKLANNQPGLMGVKGDYEKN